MTARNILDTLVGVVGMSYSEAEDTLKRLDRAGWEIVDTFVETQPRDVKDVQNNTTSITEQVAKIAVPHEDPCPECGTELVAGDCRECGYCDHCERPGN